jgi:zinc transporter, ZIP family
MSWPQIVLLGAIAGYTIFFGLPFARVKKVSDAWRISAGAISAGVLLFLLIDVTKQMLEPIEKAAQNLNLGSGDLVISGGIALVGITLSYFGLVFVPQWFTPETSTNPGQPAKSSDAKPLRLALLIAVGVGLHNFAEGLAIGQSAASGAVSLAWLLILGFGLHNMTEGFGITGPLIGKARPSWKFLAAVGLIGGTPTLLGTLAGSIYSSPYLSVLFLALAAGSIIFVVQTLIHSGLSSGRTGVFSSGLLLGLIIGIATDLIIVAAGI